MHFIILTTHASRQLANRLLIKLVTHLQVELEAVRPDGAEQAEEEYRLSVALLPLRLRIDQNIVAFLQDFFSSSCDRGSNERMTAEELTVADASAQQSEGETGKGVLISGRGGGGGSLVNSINPWNYQCTHAIQSRP